MIKRVFRFLKRKLTKTDVIITKIPVNITKLFEDKVAIVFGGTGAIGEVIVKAYVEAGAKVIVVGRNVNRLKYICSYYSNTKMLKMDLNDYDSYEVKIEEAVSLFGKIDICVNAAGVQSEVSDKRDFFNTTVKDYDFDMNTNLKSVFFVCQKISQYMIANNIEGHICNIISEMGFRSAFTPYDISRWGGRGFIKGLSVMLAPFGIVVNGVAPGITSTEMAGYKKGMSLFLDSHPNKRYAVPEEIANTCLFLTSEFGNNVVGEIIISDGGSHLNL